MEDQNDAGGMLGIENYIGDPYIVLGGIVGCGLHICLTPKYTPEEVENQTFVENICKNYLGVFFSALCCGIFFKMISQYLVLTEKFLKA